MNIHIVGLPVRHKIMVSAEEDIAGLVGYTPNIEQPEPVLLALRTLYALVPSLCNMIAFFIALAYPISGDLHQEIRRAIARRQNGETVVNPLQPSQSLS